MKIKKTKIYLAFALLAGLVIFSSPWWLVNERTVYVTKADNKGENNLVNTDGEGTYVYNDTLHYLRWDSQDGYGQIIPNNNYKIEYYGIRFGLLSIYPNIISFERLSEKPESPNKTLQLN